MHHLEGHLLSPLLAAPQPAFPFVALLVSGGHSQFYAVHAVGEYALLGDTLDDAAGEAFDKTAKLLGLPYPGGPALAQLAARGRSGAVSLPRPMLESGDLDLSFSGLKTAVRTEVFRDALPEERKADIAREFQDAIVDVLVAKTACRARRDRARPPGRRGRCRRQPSAARRLAVAAVERGATVFFPDLQFCTDNGAMIALVGALRLQHGKLGDYRFTVLPRWELSAMAAPRSTLAIS